MRKLFFKTLAIALMILLAFPPGALLAADAQAGSQQGPPQGPPPLSAAQLEQLLAPIALYPDALLSQVLMASTYPLEVVEAARWSQANPKVTGKALDEAMQKQNWDPSVKSLATFPSVLAMMNDKLDWTEQLGNAFLDQQKDVMDAVQRLRAKAQAQGALKSSPQQTVVVHPATSTAPQVIVIQPAQPEVVYVPSYNPTVVYGAWAYPAYPPYPVYPPGYVAATSMISFSAGVAAGYAMWGNFDWPDHDVDIDVNHYTNFTHVSPPPPGQRPGIQPGVGSYAWSHDPAHRRGVPYNNPAVAQRFNRPGVASREQERLNAREAFRGRTDIGHSPARPAAVGHSPARQAAGGHGAVAPGRAGGGVQHSENRVASQRHQPGQRQEGQSTRPRESGGAFKGLDRGEGAHFDQARGAGSRKLMQSHPGGGGFHPESRDFRPGGLRPRGF